MTEPDELSVAGANSWDAPSGYLKAAALLSSFDPEKLQPFGELPPRPNSFQELLASSTVVYDQENRPRWTLRNEVRRHVLKSLGSAERMRAALAANAKRPNDDI